MSYTSYIIHQTGFIVWLLDHLRKWKYRWRGRILKENCLLLQFTSIFSYTIDARITKPICMIPLCIQMVATYLKYFYIFHFWKNSDFSDFTQKMQFLWEFITKLVQFFLNVWGMSYTSYIKWVLSCDFQITPANGNIDGGGVFWKKIVCYFSLPASSPALLMLESPNLYSWYPYAYRWWQRIWNFSTSSSFEIIQILFFCDFSQKYKFSALKKVSLVS